jgi:hypothetical protein
MITLKHHTDIRLEGVDWINLALDKYQWMALENSNKPSGSIKYGEFLD